MLVANGQFLTSFCTASCQYTTTILGCHALAEPMFVHAAAIVWLKCSFHFVYIFVLFIFPLWAAKLRISFEITKNNGKIFYFDGVFL